MRVADYIMGELEDAGVETVFMVSGGGNMHLTDALKSNGHLKYVCTHHEQSAAMAAVGYAKASRRLGAVLVTTGCGGTNTLTGLLHAWQDNVPCVFISGQVAVKDTIKYGNPNVRQMGMQEADILSMVSSVTKRATMVTSVHDVMEEVQKAITFAMAGRKGPVWLDIPVDIQKAEMPVDIHSVGLLEMFSSSKRPLIVAGQGIWLSHAENSLKDFAERNNIPVVFTRLGLNSLEYNHPLHIGEIGIKGTRAANLAVQNADLLLVLGSRLSKPSIGYNQDMFAREAKIVIVDIDSKEHLHWKKHTLIRMDVGIWLDGYALRERMTSNIVDTWVDECATWKAQYPVLQPFHEQWQEGVHMYHFIDSLSKVMPDNAVVVSDAGSSVFAVSQGIKLKKGQIYVTSGAQAEMGFTLPACLGIVTMGDKVAVGITGDGSFQMNIQELQTMKHHNFPIKLFILNNGGYLSIRAAQDKNFNKNFIGIGENSGISFPDTEKIAKAYGLAYKRFENSITLLADLEKVFVNNDPMVCEIMCNGDQEIAPIVNARTNEKGETALRPMEDMYPFLEEEEYLYNMHIIATKR